MVKVLDIGQILNSDKIYVSDDGGSTTSSLHGGQRLPLRRGVLEINPTLFSDRFKYVLALFIVVLKCWKIVLEK